MKLLVIKKSEKPDKKLKAIFENNGVKKTIHFGSKKNMDYILYSRKDHKLADINKKNYIARHKTRENWNNPLSAGCLSRYILWQERTLRDSIKYYRNKFKI